MSDDLRVQLSDIFVEHVDGITGDVSNLTRRDLGRAADNAADAILARFAVAGVLPERVASEDAYGQPSHNYLHGWGRTEVWVEWYPDHGMSVCYGERIAHTNMSADRTLQFAAALIAAYRHAQEAG